MAKTALITEEERAQLTRGRRWRMLIDGELHDAASSDQLDVVDPARGERIATVPHAGALDVGAAVDAARSAAALWREVPAAERARVVLRIADIVERHAEELARLDTLDSGTPLKVMRADARIGAERLRYFAGLALQLRGETLPTPERNSIDFTLREPYGVVARIVPFNHPLMFAVAGIAAPLVAGNAVVVKPSEHTCLSSLRWGELIATEIPRGLVNVVTGSGLTAGVELVRHPGVRRIAFTGGVAAGRAIQRAAADGGVKTVTLELGGKNPMILFADCDVEAAIAGAVRGMNFTWMGQSCGSTSRLYVHRSLFDRVVASLSTALDQLVIGDPFDAHTDVGAIAYRAHYDRVRDTLAQAAGDSRACLVTGGLPSAPPFVGGFYVRPTLYTLNDDEAPLVRNEIFGPVLVALPFDEYDEVIERANASAYGLTASVWTRDLGVAMRAVRDLEAGYVWVNWSSSHIPGSSFGGVKDSGIGREEGIEELLSYGQVKNVYLRY